jgi:hypothetical protein
MLSSTIFPTVPIDQGVPAGVDSRHTPFPVARGTRGGALHLVDGDGASLCEAFTEQQLERLPLTWAEVIAIARCRVCDMLGSPPARP